MSKFLFRQQWHFWSATRRASTTALLCTNGVQEAIKHVERTDNILRSTHDLYIPEESFYNFFMRQMVAFRERIALIDGISGRSYRYSDIYHLSRKYGTCLQRHGFKENDVMAVLSPNRLEYTIAVLGVPGCRGILTTVNPADTIDEAAEQLRDSGAKMLAVDEGSLEKALRIADKIGLEKLFVFGENSNHDSGVVSWNDILGENSNTFPTSVDAKHDDTVFLLYSSGTTGRPKGVMLSHKNIISNILQASFCCQTPEVKTILGLLPLFHSGGLIIILLSNLYNGKQVVLLPSFQPDTYLETVVNYKVDSVGLVPPVFLFNIKHPLVEKYDLSHVKEFGVGAAPCAANILEAMEKKFPNAFIRQVYGMTETSPLAVSLLTDHMKTGSAGIPVPSTEIKIEDVDTGEALGPNQLGEICMRGPQVMKGYLGNDVATSLMVKKDGWLHSGDVGYYDDENHLYIVDRVKELIKYKGLQVAPADLEDLLLSHPSVLDAAVVGIPHETAGEVPKAFVVRKDDVTESQLMEFVASKVAKHRWIRGGIEFVDAVPKSPSGKILRRYLRHTASQTETGQ